MKKIYNHSCPSLNNYDVRNVLSLFKSKMIAYGKENKKLSSIFLSNKKIIPCGSGNQALIIALKCLMKSNKSKTILISNYSCPSIFSVINILDLNYEIIDVEKNYLISPRKLEDVLEQKKYLALIIPHIFGLKVNTKSFVKYKISVIEDFAHTIPDGLKLYGDFAIFSFSATKTLAAGEGGALVVNNKKNIGILNDLFFLTSKYNYSPFIMSDIQAKLVLGQLERKKVFKTKRFKIAKIYFEGLDRNYVTFTFNLDNFWNVFRLPILIKNSKYSVNLIIKKLEKEKIIARRPELLLSNFVKEKKKFPNSEYLFNNTFSLPLYPSLSLKESKYILNITNKVLKEVCV